MNINYNKPSSKVKKLNESEDIDATQFAQLNSKESDSNDVKLYQKLLSNENNLYKFSNGKFMAKFNANIDVNSKFSLKWHAENTETFDEFINSVQSFIHTEIPKVDVSKLEKEYKQFYPDF